MKYYHITDEKCADAILREGLVPMTGANSMLAGEDTPYVYVCDKDSIAHWQILLDRDVVLSVTAGNEYVHNVHDYYGYRETVLDSPIPAQYIMRAHVQCDRKAAMRHLCLSYLWMVSGFCTGCAEYYTKQYHDGAHHTDEKLECLKQEGTLLTSVLERLDYHVVSKDKIINELKHMGEDGEFTICDTYYDENKRLWEKLAEYGHDSLEKLRLEVKVLLEKNLDGCLYVNTGGFC